MDYYLLTTVLICILNINICATTATTTTIQLVTDVNNLTLTVGEIAVLNITTADNYNNNVNNNASINLYCVNARLCAVSPAIIQLNDYNNNSVNISALNIGRTSLAAAIVVALNDVNTSVNVGYFNCLHN